MRVFQSWKEMIRRSFAAAGYRVTRSRPSNRFQAMDESLILLRSLGYDPKVVIDAGANVGTWTQMCYTVFPAASYHLIEPQPACVERLATLVQRIPRSEFHRVALTSPGVSTVWMSGAGTTGAWVTEERAEHDATEIVCPATTLDELLSKRISVHDRALLKLDLESHELAALMGSNELLPMLEVVITEVHFYPIGPIGGPILADMVAFFQTRDFELYDIACLSQRPRDMRLRMGDVVFVRRDSSLFGDRSWE